MTGKNSSETKAEKFKRIASKRTQNVLDAIRKLGNCSNKAVYEYRSDDITKIFNAIDKELKRIRTSFNPRANESKFSL